MPQKKAHILLHNGKKSENMDYIMLIPPTTYDVCGGFFVHCAVQCNGYENPTVDDGGTANTVTQWTKNPPHTLYVVGGISIM